MVLTLKIVNPKWTLFRGLLQSTNIKHIIIIQNNNIKREISLKGGKHKCGGEQEDLRVSHADQLGGKGTQMENY